MRRPFLLCCGLIALVLALFASGMPSAARAQEAKKEEKKEDKPQPKIHAAKLESFQVELPVKGYLEAAEMTELMLKPDSWSSFQVVKALPHGSVVKKGDQLVWLDMTKIDESIKDSEQAQVLADLAHRMAVEDLRFFEKLAPLDMAAAEQANRHAQEDLKHFMERDKALTLESIEQSFKGSQHNLEYTAEELKQLEKMYKSKDLTEDTEELILKRQRRAVDNAKFYLKYAESTRDRQLSTELPRRERSTIEAAERAGIAFEKTKLTLPMQLRQRKLQLEAATRERTKAAEKLAKLRKDREMMVISAPVDGILYYGRCQKGQFSSGSSVEQMLQPAGSLSPNQVFLTIIDPSKLFIRASVEEKERHQVKNGVTGKTTATAYPDWKFASKVSNIAEVPSPGGGFEALLTLEPGDGYAQLRPGLATTTKLVVYKKDSALVVPDAAVFKEEDDDEQRFVYLSLKKDGKWVHEKRPVTVGKKSGSKVEILKGLADGDQILQAKPSDDAK